MYEIVYVYEASNESVRELIVHKVWQPMAWQLSTCKIPCNQYCINHLASANLKWLSFQGLHPAQGNVMWRQHYSCIGNGK